MTGMDQSALDVWFAQADDVLTDWHGSDDAMFGRVPATDDAEALHGDSYYDQLCHPRRLRVPTQPLVFDPDQLARFNAAIRQLGESFARMGQAASEVVAKMNAAHAAFRVDQPSDPRQRALQARRNRNTGPPNIIGLDGRRHR